MFHLRLLGGASIDADGVALGGTGAQRRRLALLALLATSPPGGINPAVVRADVAGLEAAAAEGDLAHAASLYPAYMQQGNLPAALAKLRRADTLARGAADPGAGP